MKRYIKCKTQVVTLSDVINALQSSKYRDNIFKHHGEYVLQTEGSEYIIDVIYNTIYFFDAHTSDVAVSYPSIEAMKSGLHM